MQISKKRRIISEKVKERAEVGILMGYEGIYIFKIYISSRRDFLKNRIIRFLNVRFNKEELIIKLFQNKDNSNIPILIANRGEIKNQDI